MNDTTTTSVLLVDDDSASAASAATMLEREDDQLSVEVATSASAGLDRLAADEFDCVVSDYDMPGQNGIEFLEAVREEYPGLPFVLYTGKGSEDVASEAISAGVTDYFQKASETSHYEVLAHRIGNAVESYRSQKAVEEAQQTLSQLAENSDEVLFLLDSDWSELLFVNSAYEDIWGQPIDELEANPRSFLDTVHPDDYARVEQALDRIREGKPIEVEHRVLAGENEVRWTYSEAKPVFDDDGTFTRIVGFVRDITERKRKERELRRERDRYTTLFDNLPAPVVHGHMIDGDAVVQSVNPAFENTFGYESADIEGEPLHDYILPDGETDLQSLNRRLLERGELRTELRRETDHGVRDFRVDITVRNPESECPEGYAVYTDITERKEREDALEELHDATRDLMLATTTEEVATRASGTATKVLEHPMNGLHLYEPEADVLAPVAWTDGTEDLLGGPPPGLPLDDSLAGQVYRTGRARSIADLRAADGTFDPETPFRSECILPLGDHGVFILSSPESDAFDATDEALAQVFAANVEAALARVERRQQLQRERDRLDEFASIISHDLRNPLNVATVRLKLARAECDSDHLDDVAQAHDRMDALIDDVFTLAQEGKRVDDQEVVDLADTIEDCWRTVGTAEATLLTETEVTINADPSRLKQLLENLFRNAIEHGGETVTVTVGDLSDRDGFYVADDGPGIPEGERDEVFDAGYSTAETGNGFGLSIVQEIVEAHGWDVAVTDSETGGARFEITGVETAGR